MVSFSKEAVPLQFNDSTPAYSNSGNSGKAPQDPGVGRENAGLPTNAAAEHRTKLERRLQAQLRDGKRSRDVKRLQDPLVRHLLRVAGNASYRNMRQSVIVTGKSLICELLNAFPCRRLALRRQSIAALQASLPGFRKFIGFANATQDVEPVKESKSESAAKTDGHSDLLGTRSPLNFHVETHYVSNRILRKVAGFHSYDDGCIAEMQMPEPADNFGNIRLLLCLGRLPSSIGQNGPHNLPAVSAPTHDSSDSGATGTLLRTAAALQWQGAWILPSCPDVFNPLAIRASQGALFWLPYRFGSIAELVQLCKEQDLAVCIPHEKGTPAKTPGILGSGKKKGVCLILDSSLQSIADAMIDGASTQKVDIGGFSSDVKPLLGKQTSKCLPSAKSVFKPDMFLSLGADVAPDKSMQLLHPITVASLLLYHTKQAHFPNLRGSPFLFSVGQKS
ncbi:uncharacterized protein LOC34619334 [Cyclospora cayetanensis]|uniref:Uncharacterized protein LOC34619334 n=1 Tax=Cyclospora cayetanensis TaxID=88456 RepID=A0A6P5WE99_9EIME|nr:uncharacterized protein LOC34619334 [Cyclospora cayetanensis]